MTLDEIYYYFSKHLTLSNCDILFTGVTGAGKSTTLNSIFGKPIAKVGEGVDPETLEISSYKFQKNIRLWDSPGLGHGVEEDKIHSKKIIDMLKKTNSYKNKNFTFIDYVVVIIEGSKKDLGTTYKLLNEVILPNFNPERIFIAINQADQSMKGRFWNYTTNEPELELINYLEDLSISIQNRIYESTKILIKKPIYFSAMHNYNIELFLETLIKNIPYKPNYI